MGQYVTPTTDQTVFVSGQFVIVTPGLPPPPEPPVAIEILREFGPSEFIGKVYVQKWTEWVPVAPEGASQYWWFKLFPEHKVYFHLKGSGRWEVEWFRFESSTRNPNPYLAVALRQKDSEVSQKPSAIPGTQIRTII